MKINLPESTLTSNLYTASDVFIFFMRDKILLLIEGLRLIKICQTRFHMSHQSTMKYSLVLQNDLMAHPSKTTDMFYYVNVHPKGFTDKNFPGFCFVDI